MHCRPIFWDEQRDIKHFTGQVSDPSTCQRLELISVSHQTRLHPRSTVIVVHSILGRPIVPSLGSRWPRHYTQRSVAVDAALPPAAETGDCLMTEQSTILPAKHTRLLATQVYGNCGELGPGIWKLQRLISLYLKIYKRL
jgi:hypothetical protein